MAAEQDDPTKGRWLLAGAAVLVQLALGAVYAWSVFVNPFIDQMGWSRTQTALPFIVTIGVLFIGTLVGGRIQDRIGPRPVVLAGGIIYSCRGDAGLAREQARPTLAARAYLRGSRGAGPWGWLHRSNRHAGQVVS